MENTTKNKIVFQGFNTLGQIKNSLKDIEVAYIQKTLYPTLKNGEIFLVLYRAKKMGLDVLQGELTSYAVKDKYGNRQLTMIVSKDAKMRLAKQTGNLDFIKVSAVYRIKTEKGLYKRVTPWEGGELWGAIAKLRRADVKEPFEVMVKLSEYNSHMSIWKVKPETMIKKVAVSQVLTMAFPELFAGVYDGAELPDTSPAIADSAPLIEGGEKMATDQQLTTIKQLGGDTGGSMTKQEAAEKIKSLVAKK